MAEERALHESKLAKMESEMKMVFQQKVNEKEAKLKQSEEELYARHREMKEALEKQRVELEEKKRRLESGRPLTPEKVSSLASSTLFSFCLMLIRISSRSNRLRRRVSSAPRQSRRSHVFSLNDPLSSFRVSPYFTPLRFLIFVGVVLYHFSSTSHLAQLFCRLVYSFSLLFVPLQYFLPSLSSLCDPPVVRNMIPLLSF
jgi:hypothetical protein